MKCDDVQRILPEVMEGNQNSEFQTHVETCTSCSELVSDLELISSEARQLAEADEPPARLWVAIAAELRAEGLIRDAQAQPVRTAPAPRRWNAWWLVPVAAALLAAGSYIIKPKSPPQMAQQPVQQQSQQQVATVTQPQPQVAPSPGVGKASNPAHDNESSALEDQQLLQVVSTRAPHMKTTYESQLRAVNSYIAEVRTYVQQHPEDEDARQQLMDAYEQKAMLYQMAMDHVQ